MYLINTSFQNQKDKLLAHGDKDKRFLSSSRQFGMLEENCCPLIPTLNVMFHVNVTSMALKPNAEPYLHYQGS